ncbi:helix-turn-helix domain-containing protein [uncultured Tateyamaria sp.]|uniref:winged helix-turn-helix transcriptional regulator n=1 Tax=uncultured Tateyamaria sp. TaxID=455651 RepID=UPI002629826E|nr:helix-turn-helix domain-containing protein [uncultured Tateyamaria sp.]
MSNPESDPIRQSPVPMDQCGAALALDVLPDRWTWMILRELFYGVGRFADIQDDIGIPKSVLSGRLAKMVENDLILKEAYRDGTSRTRHAYVLTQKGRELVPVIVALMQWGDKHIKGGKPALEFSDRRNGNAVKFGIAPEGGVLPLRRLTYTPVWDRPENKV